MRRIDTMVEEIIASRAQLPHGTLENRKAAEEGGCGVTGFIANIPINGRHIFEPSVQMHNRGNGKGGGIAAVGLSPQALGVTQDVLDTHYLLQIALLDPTCAPLVEKDCIEPYLEISHAGRIPTVDDYREITGLEIRPPDVMRYCVRVKERVLDRFIEDNALSDIEPRHAEDEFIYQNSFRLNQKFYASLGEKRAFVLSHGRNLMILKIVGYAELLAKYYLLENFQAHGWIAHQRYPTKGRVWHPGGAHPFIGLDEALVHNGDFANYHSITEYLKQYNISPQFLTDTEVSVLLFDLWNRTFAYPPPSMISTDCQRKSSGSIVVFSRIMFTVPPMARGSSSSPGMMSIRSSSSSSASPTRPCSGHRSLPCKRVRFRSASSVPRNRRSTPH
jgi:glutamate synthase domain-containing protein 1